MLDVEAGGSEVSHLNQPNTLESDLLDHDDELELDREVRKLELEEEKLKLVGISEGLKEDVVELVARLVKLKVERLWEDVDAGNDSDTDDRDSGGVEGVPVEETLLYRDGELLNTAEGPLEITEGLADAEDVETDVDGLSVEDPKENGLMPVLDEEDDAVELVLDVLAANTLWDETGSMACSGLTNDAEHSPESVLVTVTT